ncbi:MAG: hypothetical protein WCC80_03450 [Pseudolabrys sp.]
MAAPIESVLSDELENFANVDRKQHSVKQKHRIELCRQAIHDEQDIACDSKSAQRQYGIHAKGREHGKRCQKSHVIDPRHGEIILADPGLRSRSVRWSLFCLQRFVAASCVLTVG